MSLEKSNVRLMDFPEEATPREIILEDPKVPEVNSWIITDLPSRSLFYSGKQLIGRPLGVIEVKKTTSITPENVDEIIDSIISTAVTGIDINDICVGDKLYILYWLRAQTFINDGFKVQHICNICEKSSAYHFTIANMEQNFIPDDFDPSWLTFTNPLDNKVISYKPRTIGDEAKVKYFHSKMSKNITLDIDLLNIAIQIKSIDGNPVNLTDSYNYLIKNAENFSVIATFMSKTEFSLSPIFTITCKECGEVSHSAISFQPEFMLPSYYAKRNS